MLDVHNSMLHLINRNLVEGGINVLVFPVSRHATLAQVSWLSTSHFLRLRMTRLRSWKEVFVQCFWAS